MNVHWISLHAVPFMKLTVFYRPSKPSWLYAAWVSTPGSPSWATCREAGRPPPSTGSWWVTISLEITSQWGRKKKVHEKFSPVPETSQNMIILLPRRLELRKTPDPHTWLFTLPTSCCSVLTLRRPLTLAGQSYGRGGGAGVTGGLGHHPGLRCVSGRQPGSSTATYGVCSDGECVCVCVCVYVITDGAWMVDALLCSDPGGPEGHGWEEIWRGGETAWQVCYYDSLLQLLPVCDLKYRIKSPTKNKSTA